MGEKRFAVLVCADDSDYVKNNYGGYFRLFALMLTEQDEKWDMFHVSAGEFPSDEEIGQYHGFAITGSCSDAHGDDVWITNLLDFIRKLDSLKKQILGICFGHQILCRALGGKTGRAKTGWDISVRRINFSSSAKLLSSLEMPAYLPLIECHRDEVQELPPKAEVIGWSDKTEIEMFMCGNHVMGIQGHPEYTMDILLHLIDRLVERKLIEEAYADEVKVKVGKSEPAGRVAWKSLCISFLKGEL